MVEKEAPAGVGSGVVLIMAIVNVAIGASVSKILITIIDIISILENRIIARACI